MEVFLLFLKKQNQKQNQTAPSGEWKRNLEVLPGGRTPSLKQDRAYWVKFSCSPNATSTKGGESACSPPTQTAGQQRGPRAQRRLGSEGRKFAGAGWSPRAARAGRPAKLRHGRLPDGRPRPLLTQQPPPDCPKSDGASPPN